MTTLMHYGKYVNSEEPITGVGSMNRVNWDFVDFNDEICLTCEEIISEIESDESLTADERESESEYLECDSSHTRLFGGWIKDADGLHEPDKSSEYSAIERESVIQVVWSRITRVIPNKVIWIQQANSLLMLCLLICTIILNRLLECSTGGQDFTVEHFIESIRAHIMKGSNMPKKIKPHYSYKTVDTRTLKGINHAEYLRKTGWKIIACGYWTIVFEKNNRKDQK